MFETVLSETVFGLFPIESKLENPSKNPSEKGALLHPPFGVRPTHKEAFLAGQVSERIRGEEQGGAGMERAKQWGRQRVSNEGRLLLFPVLGNKKRPKSRGFKKPAEIGHGSSAHI